MNNVNQLFEKSQAKHQLAIQQSYYQSGMNALHSQSLQHAKNAEQRAGTIVQQYNVAIQNLTTQYNQNLQNVNANLSSLLETNKELVNKANQIGSDCLNVRNKCQDLQKQYQLHSEKNANLTKNVLDLARQMDESNKKITELSETCKSNLEEVESLDTSVGCLSLKLALLLEKEKSTNERLEEMKVQMKRLKQIIESSDEEKDQIIKNQNLEIQKIESLFDKLFSKMNIIEENDSNTIPKDK